MSNPVDISVDYFLSLLQAIPSLVRWKEWYSSKIPFLFVAFFSLSHIESTPAEIGIPKLIFSLLFYCSYLAFGYLINDYSDRNIDKAAGKKKIIQDFSDLTILFLLLFLSLFSGFMAFLCFNNLTFAIVFLSVAYFFGIYYSMFPIRFKERGILGAAIASFTQRVIPILLFSDMFRNHTIEFILLIMLFELIGIRWILVHQILDIENDRKFGVSTFTTEVGFCKANRLLRCFFFPLELVCLCIFLYMQIVSIPFLWVVPCIYGLVVLAKWVLWKGHGKPYMLETFSRQPLEDFYYILWPLGLALLLAVKQPTYWAVFVFYLVWERSFLGNQAKILLDLTRKKLGHH